MQFHSSKRLIRLTSIVILLLLPSSAFAYGFSVHRLVNRAATTQLPASFQGFAQWVDDLEDLSTAADERKCCVSGESIKHYINIDDYPEFFARTLAHIYSQMVAQYGQSRVDGNGTVPWAIDEAYQDLVSHFQNEDWSAAVASAADIGHYVADVHNPMHLTLNYNGQLTGQNGIHSRHESQMTGQHLAELVPPATPGLVSVLPNPLDAVFTWIDDLYPGVQQILDADLVAKAAAGGSTSSGAYFDRLWLEIGAETTTWIRDASIDLASVWYTAWIAAGSPSMPGDATGAEIAIALPRTRVLSNIPNPFNPSTQLRYELASSGAATLQIVDSAGRRQRHVKLGNQDIGFHEFQWNGRDDVGNRLPSGVYRVIVTDSAGQSSVGRAVLVK